MTLDAPLHAASENLLATYWTLGMQAPGARRYAREGFEACLGDWPHALCNFACRLNIDEEGLQRLWLLAASRPQFQVYALPADRPVDLAERLHLAGFSLFYRQHQLVAHPTESPEGLPLKEVWGPAERARVSRFMMSQFFPLRRQRFRREIAMATTSADSLRLFVYEPQGLPLAAAMVSETPGVLGVYNLCVARTARRQGIGRKLVQSLFSMAIRQNCLVTLQAQTSLESWYHAFGFETVGFVEAFGLSHEAQTAKGLL